MKQTIVFYYSNNGSNRYLAHKIASELEVEIEEIHPIINKHLMLLMGLGLGLRKLKHKVSDYDKVILCGPIWMGKLIFPLKKFITNNQKQIKELEFVTCCGSSFEMKDQKFGHNLVFNRVKDLLPDTTVNCTALPITLAVPETKREDPQTVMATRLSDSNFKGEIKNIFDSLIASMA